MVGGEHGGRILIQLHHMGNDKRKRTKQTPDTDNSDFDENSQPPTTSTNDTSHQHFPRFILVESKEEGRQITSLSPFLIQKVIQSIAGEPENIKKTKQIEPVTH